MLETEARKSLCVIALLSVMAGCGSNADIFLPMPPPWAIFASREDPVSWTLHGGDVLILGTQRYVISLRGGQAQWATRIPSQVKYQWMTKVHVSLGPDNTILAIQWTDSTQSTTESTQSMTLCALSGTTGKVLDTLVHEIPNGLTPQVLGAMHWRGGLLVLTGDPGYSHAKVESVLWFSWVKDRIALSTDKPIAQRIRNWMYVGQHIGHSGIESIVVRHPEPRGVRIGSLRSREGTFVVTAIEDLPSNAVGEVLDMVSAQRLVIHTNRFRKKEASLVGYDLHRGRIMWEKPLPRNMWFLHIPSARIAGESVFVVGSKKHEPSLCAVDTATGALRFLASQEQSSLKGPLYVLRSNFFVAEDQLFFATGSPEDTPDNESVSHIYRVGLSGGTPKLVATVLVRADKDELFGPQLVNFLLPSRKGYWVGFADGVVAYREYGLHWRPREVRIKWGEVGWAAAAAVPPFITTLKDRDERLRKLAACMLGEIGAPAKGAIPALSEALKDKDKDVRDAAAEALKRIKGTAPKR